ncbi:MAG: tRNA (guanosine(37)-N1)-methyltransferase TrmD [Chthoniobacter sp.]|uniref:tRNA (guanosine(37)-N1)-methyltransferase TrmD n=1 Tax=Chthoniobacter sp. TaxID=2510640 RepID=UPI0032A6112C
MRIDILTLFPTIAAVPLGESMIGKAQQRGLVTIQTHNLRDWARDKHHTTDDAPYGGSQGMVMKCEPIFEAVEELKAKASAQFSVLSAQSEAATLNPTEHSALSTKHPSPPRVIFLTPGGKRFDQQMATAYAQPGSHLILLCGHYEGIDQRVIDHLVDAEISIGDYVLTNGAIAAAVVTDAIVRLLPGVLGDENSAPDDSFASGLIEGPQYTRPVEFRGWRVPDILLSGNHGAIAQWRREQALAKTRQVRPDLLE